MSDKTKNIIIAVLATAVAYSVFFKYSKNDLERAEEAAYQDGFDSGYEVGYDDGHEVGYNLGYDEGTADGYKKGYAALKPVSMPENGAILSGKEYKQSKITVTASSNPCVVSLKDIYGTERVTFFVRPFCTATINVPKETMYVYFATGKQWFGYGKGLMFGEDTVYSKDSNALDFKKYTWEYTLYPVTNGNFSQSPSTEYEFF